MHKRKIKIWMIAIVVCLIAAGTLAYLLSKQDSFYRGVEALDRTSLKIRPTAAVILADETVEAAPAAQTAQPQIAPEPKQEQQSEQQPEPKKIQPKNQPVKSPCYENTIPIIKNGEIVGCGYIK